MLLAEFLAWFFPLQVRSLRNYLISCALATAIAGLLVASVVRLNVEPGDGAVVRWAAAAAVGVLAGYALVYPFVRGRLAKGR